VEKRLASVENLVSQLLPGIDLDNVLSSPELTKGTLPVAESPTSEPFQLGPSSLTPGSSYDTPHEPVIPEAVPNDADGFNWQEENVSVDGLTDGMAALSVEPAGVGYLGNSIEAILTG
jgi:transcriptional regulatory protein GAL4